MLTKTGLRPRESRRNGDGSAGLPSIQKPPPIVAATAASRDPHSNDIGGGRGGVKVTARMLRARREGSKTRFAATAATTNAAAAVGKNEDGLARPSAGGRGRQELRLPTLPGKGKAGRVLARPKRGASWGRTKTGGGGRGGKGADSGARPIRKRPEWDDSLRDPSQYRLTPEEAMARKISLVSKHNTFAFGLGSNSRGGGDAYNGLAGFCATTTSKEAIGPLSVKAARARSARRVGERARKVADGEQRNHRRTRNEGGVSAPRGGKDAVSPPAPFGGGDGDLTVSGNGEENHETGGPNDLTMPLYAVRDNNKTHAIEDCDGPLAEAAAGHVGRARFNNGDSSANRSGSEGHGGGGGGGGSGGGSSVAASGLAEIEVGIKAFSRTVSRLETCRKGRLGAGEGREEMEGERGAVKLKVEKEEEETLIDWGRTRTDGVGVTPEDDADRCRLSGPSLREATHPKDVAAGEHRQTPVRTTATSADDDNNGYFAESGRKVHGTANACCDTEPSTTQLRREGGKFCGHGHGSTEAVDLMERVQVLEEQVMRAGLAPPHVPWTARKTPDKKTGGNDLFRGAGREGQETSAARSAENMRVVIADLLSLTSLLLERPTVAERRLAQLSEGRGTPAPDGVEYDSEPDATPAATGNDLHDEVLLVRAKAEASILAGDGDHPPEGRDNADSSGAAAGAAQNDDFGGVSGGGGSGGGGGGACSGGSGGGSGDGGDTYPSPREWTHSSSSFIEPPTDYIRAGRSLAKVGPSPSFHEKRPAAPCAAAKDCWVEPLDTNLGVTPTTRTASVASMRPPSAHPMVPPLPAVVTTTAVTTAIAAADLSPIRDTGLETPYSLRGKVPLPPPPPACVAGGISRRWGARDVLTPLHIRELFLVDDMNSCYGPEFDFSVISTFEENDEKDARSLPVTLAPTPTKKPKHPFRRTTPVRPSPVVRQHVGQEGVSGDFAPVFTVGGRGQGGRSNSSRARVHDGGGGLEPPAIGQWCTPAKYVGVSFVLRVSCTGGVATFVIMSEGGSWSWAEGCLARENRGHRWLSGSGEGRDDTWAVIIGRTTAQQSSSFFAARCYCIEGCSETIASEGDAVIVFEV